VPRIFHAVQRYREGFLKESEPIIAPVPIATGGRAGAESLFLLANLLRQGQNKKIAVPTLLPVSVLDNISRQAGSRELTKARVLSRNTVRLHLRGGESKSDETAFDAA
jgi:hypothetical protein